MQTPIFLFSNRKTYMDLRSGKPRDPLSLTVYASLNASPCLIPALLLQISSSVVLPVIRLPLLFLLQFYKTHHSEKKEREREREREREKERKREREGPGKKERDREREQERRGEKRRKR